MFLIQRPPSPAPHPGTKSSPVFSKPNLTIVKRNQTAQKRSLQKMSEEVRTRRNLLRFPPTPSPELVFKSLRNKLQGLDYLTCWQECTSKGHWCLFWVLGPHLLSVIPGLNLRLTGKTPIRSTGYLPLHPKSPNQREESPER